MKRNMILTTLLMLLGLLASGMAYFFIKSGILFSLAITFGTIFYHLAMRLAVGYAIDGIFHNRMDYTRKWFREKSFERPLYEILKVKKWKKRVPTFRPEYFDLKSQSMEALVQVTCQAEIVHEINMALSFIPILFSVWFGSLGVFIITSCVAFLFDGVFVVLQRYNRPRMLRLIKKSESQK